MIIFHQALPALLTALLAQILPPPAQAPPPPTQERGVAVNRAVKRILQIFKDTGFDPALFPGKAFSPKKIDPFILQTAWEEVRKNVEVIVREEIGLGEGESLKPNFVSPDGGKSLYVFLPDYGRPDLREVINRVTQGRASKPNELSVIAIALRVAQVAYFSGNGFLPQYMSGGQPDLKKMAQGIEELIQFDQNVFRQYGLTAFSQVNDAWALIMSSWVQSAGTDTVRYYWRLHYSINRDQADQWRLNARVDIGKRLASMSEDEIRVIGDSERNLDSLRKIEGLVISAKASRASEITMMYVRRPVNEPSGGPLKVSVAPVDEATIIGTFTYTITQLGYQKLTGRLVR